MINDWTDGLPLPYQYIGIVDLFFYKLSAFFGYYIYLCGITPNIITFIGLLINIFTTWSVYNGYFYYLWSMPLYLLCDTMDGYNSRRYNQGTPFGAAFDHTADWIGGITLIVGSWMRWKMRWQYYILCSMVVWMEYKNIVYCGYIQQYNKKKDIKLSAFFQTDAKLGQLENLLYRNRNYNSSTVGLIAITAFYIMEYL